MVDYIQFKVNLETVINNEMWKNLRDSSVILSATKRITAQSIATAQKQISSEW